MIPNISPNLPKVKKSRDFKSLFITVCTISLAFYIIPVKAQTVNHSLEEGPVKIIDVKMDMVVDPYEAEQMKLQVGDRVFTGGDRNASGFNLENGGCVFTAKHLGDHLSNREGEINYLNMKNFDYFEVPGTDIVIFIAKDPEMRKKCITKLEELAKQAPVDLAGFFINNQQIRAETFRNPDSDKPFYLKEMFTYIGKVVPGISASTFFTDNSPEDKFELNTVIILAPGKSSVGGTSGSGYFDEKNNFVGVHNGALTRQNIEDELAKATDPQIIKNLEIMQKHTESGGKVIVVSVALQRHYQDLLTQINSFDNVKQAKSEHTTIFNSQNKDLPNRKFNPTSFY